MITSWNMTAIQNIRIEDYDYELPDDRIAKFPLAQRDHSKLLVRKDGRISHTTFDHLNEYLPEGTLLVFNNTRVIQARMIFPKGTGARIEIFCLEPKDPADYALSFAQNKSCTWLCMVGNSKRWKSGKLQNEQGISAERIESYGDTHLIRFEWDNPDITFADILESCGELPIPPYLNRKTEESDKETYQTVYSKINGSVAAPTAGLHFSEAVLNSLNNKTITLEELTLHVGAGTFKPVKSEIIGEHEMHTECIAVRKSTIEQLLHKKGQVFAVGTTSVRTLESLYYIGVMMENDPDIPMDHLTVNQWAPYEKENNRLSVEQSLGNVLQYLEKRKEDVLIAHTQIMIVPGYDFKIISGIITNFHQPKSTLLLLISAFLEGKWKEVYDYAMKNDFRFLSYGDSSILF